MAGVPIDDALVHASDGCDADDDYLLNWPPFKTKPLSPQSLNPNPVLDFVRLPKTLRPPRPLKFKA